MNEEINSARTMQYLAGTINAHYNPPSYVEYKQGGKYITVTNWGWED